MCISFYVFFMHVNYLIGCTIFLIKKITLANQINGVFKDCVKINCI